MGKNRKTIKKKMGRPYNKPDKEYGSPEELLEWSKDSKKPQESKRYLAIRALMTEEGVMKFEQIASMYGIKARTLNKWVHRWNSGGKEKLRNRSKSGRPRKIKEEEKQKIMETINNQEKEGKTRLTIKGVRDFLK